MKRALWISLLLLASWPGGAQAQEVRRIALATNDLIYDPVRQKIYASIPSRAGAIGNTVTVIDPATGAIGPSIFVGSEPNKLAISDDGQFLYVALDGAAAVRRIDLATGTAGLQFGLGNSQYYGPYFAGEIEVIPGSPTSIAVIRRRSGDSYGGVAIYDDGVPRPTTTTDYPGAAAIEFSAAASRLYGYSDYRDFQRMSVDASGVSVVDTTRTALSGWTGPIEYDNGRIYFASGTVVDPEAKILLGTFSGISSSSGSSLVRPSSDLGQVFFLTDRVLRAYDMSTFRPLNTLSIPSAVGATGSLIRWGAGGLAFRTSFRYTGDTDSVFLIGFFTTPPPPPPTPSISLAVSGCSVCRAGSFLTVRATVTNPSPTPVQVEVKAGVVLPNGAAMNVWTGNDRHFEVTLPAGANMNVVLLQVRIPPGLAPGTWMYEAALLTPELGRTLARDAKAFAVEP